MMPRVEMLVMGASAGGINTLGFIFERFGKDFPLPVLVTKHVGVRDEYSMLRFLSSQSQLPVEVAMDKESIKQGHIYLAPAGYHMQLEERGVISLSVDERVCHVRPAIDVLFQSAADVYGEALAAVVLSGANEDGSKGVCRVKRSGGITIAQTPQTADIGVMPASAIKTGCIDYVVDLEQLPGFLRGIPTLER